MSQENTLTSMMLRAHKTTPYTSGNRLLFNLGMNEGSGDDFTDAVTGATFTDAAGTVDHTTTPHAPIVGYDGALTGVSDDFITVGSGKVFLCFHLSKPGAGLFHTFELGEAVTGDGIAIVGSGTDCRFTVGGSQTKIDRAAVSAGNIALTVFKANLATGVVKSYYANSLATPALGASGSVTFSGDWAFDNNAVIGNESVPTAVYGVLAYECSSDYTDAQMITFANLFQQSWALGHKHLIKGL